ncbi:CSC1-like protein [Gracilariopsis chorda]|uniref:CSC1-like protein n=1 Tax=Gracilariopsis chorda TaxID=448386 RepID=A0A2V3INX8_9FLOR|nr:CSC1-like protein [Gracilariopsis chorda]|eukprot:PXF43791.1 CSC1-like protein [Gracilariopsis chorda]
MVPSIDSGLLALLWVFGLGTLATSLSLILFDYLRPRIPDIYDRRRNVLPRDKLGFALDDGRHKAPPPPSFRPYAWIGHVFTIPDHSLKDTHGLDTVMLLRFYRSCAWLCIHIGIFTTFVLIPVYATASKKNLPPRNPWRVFGIRILSLANVPRTDSWRLMLVIIFDLCITIYVLTFIVTQLNYLVRMRREYRASDHPSNYAVIVQDVPTRFTNSEMLYDFFNSIFPNMVKSVKFIPVCTKLTKYRREYWTAVRNRQRCSAVLETNDSASSTLAAFMDKYMPAMIGKKSSGPSSSASNQAVAQDITPPSPTCPPLCPPIGAAVRPHSCKPRSVNSSAYAGPTVEESLANMANGANVLGFDALTKLLNQSARAVQRTIMNEPEECVRYWTGKERKLLYKIEQERRRTEAFDTYSSTRAAIVTLKRKHEASMAAQCSFSSSYVNWFVSLVPDVHAMNWDAFSISIRTVLVRKLVAIGLTAALIVFWVIPTALIQTLANIESLSKTSAFAWLGFVNKLTPEVSGFLQGLLPALVLELVMVLVPKVIRRIVMLQRLSSQVEIEKQVLRNMIAFLYFSHLIYIVLSGSLLEYSDRIIRNPSNIVRILGTSIPEQGTFMMNVILLATLVQTPLEVVQLGRVLKRWVGMKRAWTGRDREIVNAGGSLADHFQTYAYGTIFVVLAIVYSTLAPVMIVICALFFTFSYTVLKYNLTYTFTKPWEGFAALHHIALQGITIGLIVKQMSMGGYMSVMGQATLATLEFVSAAITITVVVLWGKKVVPVLEYGAVEDLATGLGGKNDEVGRGASKKRSIMSDSSCSDEIAAEMYVHPSFSPVKQIGDEKGEGSGVGGCV